jgi:SAM-dependent methyltransferase
MDFRANDPGSSQFGNFINYYNFHPPENRINLFPDINWDDIRTSEGNHQPFLVLDVGCNSGNLTLSIYKYLTQHIDREIQVLAVDIDPALIARAVEANEHPNSIEYQSLDIMTNQESVIEEFLKKHNRCRFDVVFCLSVTMWIHLNHGDDGLMAFLEKITSKAEKLVIEPQPWKCYKTALKRMRKAGDDFPQFKHLKLRQTIETDIDSFVRLKGFKELYKSTPTKWDRTIYIYRNEQPALS